MQYFIKPQGMVSPRWDLSDLFGVLPYVFRQNWNAKQSSKSFKAVNGNCQVLQSQLWGGEAVGRKRGARQEHNLIFSNSHYLQCLEHLLEKMGKTEMKKAQKKSFLLQPYQELKFGGKSSALRMRMWMWLSSFCHSKVVMSWGK